MKRTWSVAAVLLMIVVSSLAANAILKLSSTQPLDKQFSEFRAYIDSLSEKDRKAWVREMRAIAVQESSIILPLFSSDDNDKVFVSESGGAYHKDRECRGLRFAEGIRGITIEEAEEMRRKPCKICYDD